MGLVPEEALTETDSRSSRSPRAEGEENSTGEGEGDSNGGGGRSSCCSSGSHEGSPGVYLSGFRIVQQADKSRHAEYAVVVNGRYRHWTRFSQIKAVYNALSGPSMPDTSREAWDAVRSCKSPRGRALDSAYLGRKCLAIEAFLSSLLEDMSPSYLGELIARAAPRSSSIASSPTRRSSSRRQHKWVPGAPSHISRGRSGLRISTR